MAERPEDLNLPSTVVSKIVKEALPSNVKVSKEAQAAVAKAASVFVLYATSCANNVALKSNRKTLHANDVIQAMKDMEFEKFVRPLETALDSFRDKKKTDAANKKKRKEESNDNNKEDSPKKVKTEEAAQEQQQQEEEQPKETTSSPAKSDGNSNKENVKDDSEDKD